MGASTGVHSYTAALNVNDNGDGSTFVQVAEVKDIRGPEETTGVVKLTNLNSPNATLEKAAGMIDPGKVTFTLTATKAQVNKLVGYRRVTKLWQVVWPLVGTETTPSKWQGSAFITKRGQMVPDAENNEAVTCDCELECTGQWTFTQGS